MFYLVLRKKLSFWSASQFCGEDFSSQGNFQSEKYWVYFEEWEFFRGGKDSRKTVQIPMRTRPMMGRHKTVTLPAGSSAGSVLVYIPAM